MTLSIADDDDDDDYYYQQYFLKCHDMMTK